MPSASSKPENKTSMEVETPIKQAIGVVDRKVRNLEKRKSKLDGYKEKQKAGDVLNQDQKSAMEKYEVVLQSLDFGRELQKQFAQISNDADKMLKKQQKKEKSERQAMELKRIQELLEVQAILDQMGSDDVREHFRSGKHGAAKLTDENLDSLDKLYKLISPSRDDCADHTSYAEQLTKASEHIVNFLDSKEKEVVGTATYKDLKELVGRINECGYFDKMPGAEEEEEEPVAEATKEEPPVPQEEINLVSTMMTETQITNDFYSTATDNQPEKQEETQGFEFTSGDNVETGANLHQEYVPMENNTEHASHMVDDAFFSTGQFPGQRPLDEIVDSVQGSFNFLQDSEIDLESPQHLDPAVVAAHPMPTVPPMGVAQSTDASRGQQSYQSSGMLPEEQSQVPQHGSQQQNQSTQPPATQTDLGSTLDPSAAVFVSEQSSLSSSYTNQGFSNMVSQPLPTTTQHSYSTDQTMGLGQTTPSFPGSITSTDTSDIPPAIPMPNQTSSLDSQQLANDSQMPQSQHAGSEEKKFTMNAEAAVFKSMYSQPSYPEQSQMEGDTGFGPQDGYQGSGGMNYSGNFRGGRGGGRGGRGRGSGNGFSRGGNRGGNGGFGGNRGNGRGGGRGSYQGYPPRNDYRPDGYQGSNNGYGGFGANKRGSGGMRGGPGNRGGAPRGAPRGSNPRGGRGGGFGRPGSGPQQ